MYFFDYGDAFFKLRLNQKDRTLLHEAKVFFTDLLPGWAAMSALREAFYNEQKIAVSLEVGVSLFAEMGVTADQIRESLRIADLVVPCRDAVRELTGTDDPFEAAKKMRPYCRGSLYIPAGKRLGGFFAGWPYSGNTGLPCKSSGYHGRWRFLYGSSYACISRKRKADRRGTAFCCILRCADLYRRRGTILSAAGVSES